MDKARQEMRAKLFSEIVKHKFCIGDMHVEVRIILKCSLITWQIIMTAMYTRRIFLKDTEATFDSVSAIKQLQSPHKMTRDGDKQKIGRQSICPEDESSLYFIAAYIAFVVN